LAAGLVDVDNMLDSISSAQFSEWQAFYQIYPFGASAETRRFAVQQANIVNSPHYRHKSAVSSDDFMPVTNVKKQSASDQIAMLKGLG
jgi:hypothetical protein